MVLGRRDFRGKDGCKYRTKINDLEVLLYGEGTEGTSSFIFSLETRDLPFSLGSNESLVTRKGVNTSKM